MSLNQSLILILIVVVLFLFMVIFARYFRDLTLRVKIVTGIIVTGGLALAVLSYLTLTRSGQIISTLAGRLETSVKALAEESLVNTVFTEANRADRFFEDIEGEVSSLSDYRVSLQKQQGSLSAGSYWDATSELVQLGSGQYGNSSRDVSSVFVPVNVTLDDSVLTELNTSAYLDFFAPQASDLLPRYISCMLPFC